MQVSPQHRRKGIGSALTRILLEHARKHGITEITLTTTDFHEAAIKLYKRVGFTVVRRFRPYKYLELVNMSLELD